MDNYQIARRARIGVLIPSTNTGVEYDLQKFALEGVTWHPSRFSIELRNWADENAKTGEGMDSVFERFLDMMRGELPGAVDRALSAEITHLMLGMSAETFWGGLAGNEAFEQDIQERIGQLGLSTGAAATRQALSAFGAKTISVITPYPPVGDANVRRFFNEIGFEVKHVAGLSRPTAASWRCVSRAANSAIAVGPRAPASLAAADSASTVASECRRPRRRRCSGTWRRKSHRLRSRASDGGPGGGDAGSGAGSSSPRSASRARRRSGYANTRFGRPCATHSPPDLAQPRVSPGSTQFDARQHVPSKRDGSTNVSAASAGWPSAASMSDDRRRSDSDSARDARFRARAPGRIRKRVLFATSRRRRNCRSGVQPIQASRASP